MPIKTKTTDATQAKTQPWRAVWPAPATAASVQIERKACTNGHGSAAYGYGDNEGIAQEDVDEKENVAFKK